MELADAQEMGNKYVINCFCFDSANVMEETEKVDQEGVIPDQSITQPFAEGNIELSGDNCDVSGEVYMTGDTNEMEELPEETKGTGIYNSYIVKGMHSNQTICARGSHITCIIIPSKYFPILIGLKHMHNPP